MSKIAEFILEVLAWLEIIASPLLVSLGIGAFVYFPEQTGLRLFLALVIVAAGLILGIYWANKIWKTKGTLWFVSRISATPELDDLHVVDKKVNVESGSKIK